MNLRDLAGQALRDFIEYFFVPSLVSLMPLGFGARISNYVASKSWLYAADAKATLEHASKVTPVTDAALWMKQYRFMRLRDNVDMFHWLIWGDYWFRRCVEIKGNWPSAPFVAVTFHWGGALWGLYSLKKHVGSFSGVAAPIPWQALKRRPVLYVYIRLRNRINQSLVSGGLVNPGGAARHLVRTLRQGGVICGLWDSPPQESDKKLASRLMGRRLDLPRGLPSLAVRERVAIAPFLAYTDAGSGRVILEISNLTQASEERECAQQLADVLKSALEREPANWHHWYLLANAPSDPVP